MQFIPIDVDSWPRKPYFDHFLHANRTTFSLTADIDITAVIQRVREKQRKFYPAFLYMLTRTVNQHLEFRMSFNEQGEVGYWEEMIPSYTIFNPKSETFSSIWTVYAKDFAVFYENYLTDTGCYGEAQELNPKKGMPSYAFPVSSIPWVSFTGFNLNIYNDGTYLLPIFTGGQYVQKGDRIVMPLSIQVHHAVCDGYHVGLFLADLQQLADQCEEWL